MKTPNEPIPEGFDLSGVEFAWESLHRENAALREALKELIPIAEELGNYYYTHPEAAVQIKSAIDKAKSLL